MIYGIIKENTKSLDALYNLSYFPTEKMEKHGQAPITEGWSVS